MPHRRLTVPANLNRRFTFSTWTTTAFFLCIILQQLHPNWCFQETRKFSKRLIRTQGQESALSSRTPAESLVAEKRTITSASGVGGSASQPEEIFSTNDQLESNYDEYPMVVPKRAALLLDRLMVALHHALEKERSSNARLSDFYNKHNNGKNGVPNEKTKEGNLVASDPQDKDSSYLTMYSDDDPSVMMDYDFKDLNSINRATGETLMAQSFQRRANMGLDLGGGVGLEGVSSLLSASSSSAQGGGLMSGVNSGDIASSGRANFGTNGRMYWRCYFNAPFLLRNGTVVKKRYSGEEPTYLRPKKERKQILP